jgi:hypothetical protein
MWLNPLFLMSIINGGIILGQNSTSMSTFRCYYLNPKEIKENNWENPLWMRVLNLER